MVFILGPESELGGLYNITEVKKIGRRKDAEFEINNFQKTAEIFFPVIIYHDSDCNLQLILCYI